MINERLNNNTIMSEYHLIIAWNKANIADNDILSAFPESVHLLKRFNYTWDENLADRNFAAFYGQKLNDISYKSEHCGSGKFRVYLVEDDNPVYEMRSTTSGKQEVNIHLFDLKKHLRELTGGGHLIHATDSSRELKLNIASLFGLSVEQLLDQYPADEKGSVDITRNISGVPFWNSWKELFDHLQLCTDYVVLRNAKTILHDDHMLHGDTDILVRDRTAADVILAGKKVYEEKYRVLYEVRIADRKQLIDVRYLGDKYYCDQWEQKILSCRECQDVQWLYVMDDENQKYSLLYHALVHKMAIAQDYRQILLSLFSTLDRDELIRYLHDYMSRKGYIFTCPEDKSVFIHPDFYGDISVPFSRKLKNRTRIYFNEDNERRKNKTIYKVFYRGYHMANKVLEKSEKLLGKAKHYMR